VDLVAAIERESAALLDAATSLGVDVPACPGWDVAELVRHVGSAHRNAARIVGEQLQAHPQRAELEAPEGVDPIEWLTSGTTALADALRRTDPATPVWTFGPDGTAAFWARRMAQETMVHRVDVEQANGRPSELDRELADDGIDESLRVFVPLLARPHAGDAAPGGELLLHALDGRSWVLTFGPGEVTVEDDHRKGDACVQGSAADLVLWLWGRAPTDALTLYGDPALPEHLQRICRV
jgi:uncharacterized protein (TIGR03083 family)